MPPIPIAANPSRMRRRGPHRSTAQPAHGIANEGTSPTITPETRAKNHAPWKSAGASSNADRKVSGKRDHTCLRSGPRRLPRPPASREIVKLWNSSITRASCDPPDHRPTEGLGGA